MQVHVCGRYAKVLSASELKSRALKPTTQQDQPNLNPTPEGQAQGSGGGRGERNGQQRAVQKNRQVEGEWGSTIAAEWVLEVVQPSYIVCSLAINRLTLLICTFHGILPGHQFDEIKSNRMSRCCD